MKHNRIARTFFLTMFLAVAAGIGFLGYSSISREYARFSRDVVALRREDTEARKDILRNEVENILDHIGFKKSLTEARLRNSIENRVYEAYEIAMNLCREYSGAMTDAEIKKLVKNVLSPIRFNKERGYYFITNLNGVEELFADQPEMEQQLVAMQDAEGRHIKRDLIEIARTEGEGFYQYLWTKPGTEGNNHQKIAFIKRFEPFDWLIGTSEYLDSVKEDIQKEVLLRMGRITFGDSGYIFAGQWDGFSLAGPTKGENIYDATDADGQKLVQELIKAARSGGGFVRYVMSSIGGLRSAPKISYVVGVPEWEWYVGAGMYIDEIETVIAGKEEELKRGVRNEVSRILFTSLALLAAFVLIAKFLSGRILTAFGAFEAFFQKAATQSSRMDLKNLHFPEFRALAVSANTMIDERHASEQALRESEERYRMIFDHSPLGIAQLDRDGTIRSCNDRFLEILGTSREKVLDQPLLDKIEDPEMVAAARKALEGEIAHYEGEYTALTSGKRVWSRATLGPLRSPDGQVSGAVCIVQDISARKRAENERRSLEVQVQQTQKMESLGILAGGIAHDFNNLLMGVLGNAELALDELPSFSPVRSRIQDIDTAAKRAADLCRQMLAYSGKGKFVTAIFNLNELVLEMTHLLEVSISKKVALRYNFAENLPAIEADPTQIRQIIMNLITNASEAIGDNSGLISVTTGAMQCDRAYLKGACLGENLPEGRYVFFEVADTGVGIALETMERIFDPFFSTKFTGRGLGLSAVLGIVRGHKGALKVYSEVGRGTTFKALFPAVEKPAEKLAEEQKAVPEWQGSGNVLLVDDEEAVLKVAKRMLEKLGFSVITARNGIKAVELFRKDPAGVCCVLLDLTMPEMGGEETFRELRRVRKDVRVILSSGYNEQEVTKPFAGKGLAGFIQKPYQMAQLESVLRRVLET